jgi:hypothetical protein
VIGLYLWILWRGDIPRTGTVRSVILEAFAEWSAAQVMTMELTTSRAWKPNLLVPVEDPANVRGEFNVLNDLCLPEGSIKLLGLATADSVGHLTPRLHAVSDTFLQRGTMTTYCAVDSAGYTTGIVTGLQVLRSAFFSPNILFVRLPSDTERYADLRGVLREASRLGVGQLLLALHPKAALGRSSAPSSDATAPGRHRTYLSAENFHLEADRAAQRARGVPAAAGDGIPDGASSRWPGINQRLIDLCAFLDGRTEILEGDIETALAVVAVGPRHHGIAPRGRRWWS